MKIIKDISPFIIFSEETIINALHKINKCKIVFTINNSGVVQGTVTDGDFRRWLLKQNDIDLNKPISLIQNKNFKYSLVDEEPSLIESLFIKGIDHIPLIDQNKRIISIALKGKIGFKIQERSVGKDEPVFIIAEIGNNHNGDIKLAKQLVDAAVSAGADCAKFQLRDMDKLYRKSKNIENSGEDLGAEYTLDLLARFQLNNDEMNEVFDYCNSQNIIPLCTPWDIKSLQRLEDYGLHAYKVASADLTNHDLINALLKTKKPLICSTGMCSEEEIKMTVELIKKSGSSYAFLHCNSTYPAPFKDINLSYIKRLEEISGGVVGYSGHERGYAIPVAAIGLGAQIIEKHLTLDRSMEGNDHRASLLPEEFSMMVKSIREVESSIGLGDAKSISQGEMMNREILGKSLAINRDLKKGEVFEESMIVVISPGQGLPVYRKEELIGKKSLRSFKNGDLFFPSDLDEISIKPRKYKFKRPWGLPVRYHDVSKLTKLSNLDFLEFHLSYKDLDIDIKKIFNKKYNLGYTVHAPELFFGDHILDLCSTDENYRQHSIKELQRVVDLTRKLNRFFPSEKVPMIIANVGGSSQDSFFNKKEKHKSYENLLHSLDSIDSKGVEIIPQTMPPFPWHFGGQRFHNLFVSPDEILSFCNENKYRVCLDISHSFLACNHHGWSFRNFIEKVGPLTAHLHISDSRGVDDEGLQIGKGDIDFPALAEWMLQFVPNIGFIPEIWQGHKNNGEGFWIALERLEKSF